MQPLSKHLSNNVQLSSAHFSIGGRKGQNEDSVGYHLPVDNLQVTKGACGVIADGVSSAEAGAQAAEYCVTEFIKDYFDTPDIWTVKKSAQKVLSALNRTLYSRSNEYLDSRGWICTFSAIVIKSHTAHLFHIGDSRIYRIRGDRMECLTQDHIAPLSKSNSCLSRAMGMDVHLDLDYRALAIEEQDIYLLTTDGVHDSLDPQTMQRLVQQNKDLSSCCKQLIESAYEAGSNDNISCQLIRVDHLLRDNINDVADKLTKLPFPPPLDVGMKLDGFLVEEEIYASSRSQLYKVKDIETGQTWIMKTPSPNYDDDPAFIERFIMEEWVGSRIDSAHVVKVGKSPRTKSFLYYLMQPIDGISLDQWIVQNPYPKPYIAIEIVRQIAEGLRAFHKRETLHQDLKPGNIIIDDTGHVTLVDFGSVFVAGIDEIFMAIERDKVLGTLDYSDPLIRLGQNTGIQGDLYSLASITYEIFTQHLPYGDALEHCRSPAHLSKLHYIPAHRFNAIVPLWFDRALMKGLAVDLEQRYHSLDDFLQDLTQPNPAFLAPIAESKQSRTLLFWQLMSLTWFVVAMFLIAALWLP